MKRLKLLIICILLLCISLVSCGSAVNGRSGGTGSRSNVKVSKYFWGTWQRMDNGEYYTINDTCVTKGDNYNVKSSTDTELKVEYLGTFTKQSESVMINDNIPYFRKGGRDLHYKLQIKGLQNAIARAGKSESVNNQFYVETQDKKNSSYSYTKETDINGNVDLIAPVAGNEQIVKVKKGNETILEVTGIKVDNDKSDMGTIYIPQPGEYSLKITGKIDKTDDGYLYAGKTYDMTLTITNISDVQCKASFCTISSKDSITILGEKEIKISTLKPQYTKTISIQVKCGNVSESDFKDTGLDIDIQNANGDSWKDFVPLKFYKGTIPITIAAKSTEENKRAKLNGFVIYPDRNTKFFNVTEGSKNTIYVPTFGNKEYILAFCGATIEEKLSNSTEMLYTVVPGSSVKMTIDESKNAFFAAYSFGEDGSGNETEDTAKLVTKPFEAYLEEGEIDYYKMTISSAINFSNTEYSVTDLYDIDMKTYDYSKPLIISGKVSDNDLSALRSLVSKATGNIKIDLSNTMELSEIKASAFYGCSRLSSIILPEGIVSIGNRAFSGCSNLTSITISENVSKIGSYAFEKCTNLQSVIFESNETWNCKNNKSTNKVYVSDVTVNASYLKTTYCSYEWEKNIN